MRLWPEGCRTHSGHRGKRVLEAGRWQGFARDLRGSAWFFTEVGSYHDLIPAAVGAYSENGPVGAAINPRRVRLIARRR